MPEESLKITSVTPVQAAKVLATAFGRRITEEQVRRIAEEGELLRADDTFSLIEYVAFLAEEAGNGRVD
jgi:phage tail tape-measure protein